MTEFIANTDHQFLREATDAHNRLAQKKQLLTDCLSLADDAHSSVYAVHRQLVRAGRCSPYLEVKESGRMVFQSPKQLGQSDQGALAEAYYNLAVRICQTYEAYGNLNFEYQDTARFVQRLSLEARWDLDTGCGRAVTFSYQQWLLLRHNLIVLSQEISEATELVGTAVDAVNKMNRFCRGYNPISMRFAQTFSKLADPEWVEHMKKEFGLADPEIRPMKGCV